MRFGPILHIKYESFTTVCTVEVSFVKMDVFPAIENASIKSVYKSDVLSETMATQFSEITTFRTQNFNNSSYANVAQKCKLP